MPSNGAYLAPDHNHEHDDAEEAWSPRESSPDDFLEPVEIPEEDDA